MCCTTVTITTATDTAERSCVVVRIIAISRFFSNQRLKQIKSEVEEKMQRRKKKKKEVLIVFPIIFLRIERRRRRSNAHSSVLVVIIHLLQFLFVAKRSL